MSDSSTSVMDSMLPKVFEIVVQQGFFEDVYPALCTNKTFWWDEDIWSGAGGRGLGPLRRTPIMMASAAGHADRVSWLAKRGRACLEARDESNMRWSALAFAIKQRHVSAVTALLDAGADPNAEVGRQDRMLHFACMKRRDDLVEVLLDRGADPTTPSSSGQLAIEVACRFASARAVQLMLAKGASLASITTPRKSALLCACESGNNEVALWLLEQATTGVDIHRAVTEDCMFERWTPLFFAAWSGMPTVVSKLISMGASVEVVDTAGYRPLTMACCKGHVEVARRLMDAGADFRIAMPGVGGNLLDVAFVDGYVDLACELVSRGVDIEQRDESGRTFLLRCAAGLRETRRKAELMRLLCERGCNVNAANRWGVTALWFVCRLGTGTVADVRTLLEFGADPRIAEESGTLPIHQCCKREFAEGLEMLDLLLRAGADLHARDKRGRNVIVHAIEGGSLPMVKHLISLGADPKIRMLDGSTPAEYARRCGWPAIAEALEAATTRGEAGAAPASGAGAAANNSSDNE